MHMCSCVQEYVQCTACMCAFAVRACILFVSVHTGMRSARVHVVCALCVVRISALGMRMQIVLVCVQAQCVCELYVQPVHAYACNARVCCL